MKNARVPGMGIAMDKEISGIQRMLDDDRYCVDVVVQVAAAQAALLETGRVILAGHVDNCLTDAIRSGDPHERRKRLDELMPLFSRFLRIDDAAASRADE